MKCCSVPSTSCDLSGYKVEVATSNGLGGDTFTRNVTDGRRNDFDTNLVYPFSKEKKTGINNSFISVILNHLDCEVNLIRMLLHDDILH